MGDDLTRARELFQQGIEHFESRRLEEAARNFEAALALAPGRASLLTNLGLTRFYQSRWDEAIELLEESTRADDQHVATWLTLARCLAQQGRPDEALAALDRVLTLDASEAQAWSLRGSLLRERRQLPQAAECFERAIELGADPELHRYFLAAVTVGVPQDPTPRDYIETLFDDYAGDFDQHLVAGLRYQAPERLMELLREQGAGPFDAVLDLGCGTGLCGALLRPVSRHLAGVDLSSAMLERARASGHYDALEHGDVLQALQGEAARLDLIVAADVFIYVGRLEAVFAGAAHALRAGGWFAFTVERAPDDTPVQLLPSLRHAHAESYLRRLAAENGLQTRALQDAPIREDQGRPVPGCYVVMQRAS